MRVYPSLPSSGLRRATGIAFLGGGDEEVRWDTFTRFLAAAVLDTSLAVWPWPEADVIGVGVVTDSTASWVTNQWVGYRVVVIANMSNPFRQVVYAEVLSNTSTTLTVGDWKTFDQLPGTPFSPSSSPISYVLIPTEPPWGQGDDGHWWDIRNFTINADHGYVGDDPLQVLRYTSVEDGHLHFTPLPYDAVNHPISGIRVAMEPQAVGPGFPKGLPFEVAMRIRWSHLPGSPTNSESLNVRLAIGPATLDINVAATFADSWQRRRVQILHSPSGQNPPPNAQHDIEWLADTWYTFRFAQDASYIRAMWWADEIEAEPSHWMLQGPNYEPDESITFMRLEFWQQGSPSSAYQGNHVEVDWIDFQSEEPECDEFDRTVSDGWGAGDLGPWVLDPDFPPASNFSVDGARGIIKCNQSLAVLDLSGQWIESFVLSGTLRSNGVSNNNAMDELTLCVSDDPEDPLSSFNASTVKASLFASTNHATIGYQVQVSARHLGSSTSVNTFNRPTTDRWADLTEYNWRWVHIHGVLSAFKVWKVSEQEPGTQALRSALTDTLIPADAKLYVYSQDLGAVAGRQFEFSEICVSHPDG